MKAKIAAFTVHCPPTPSIGDFLDVDGIGTTGRAEVLDVIDNLEGSHQVYFRLEFSKPFTTADYPIFGDFGASADFKHPAYVDLDLSSDDEDGAVRSGNIVWF